MSECPTAVDEEPYPTSSPAITAVADLELVSERLEKAPASRVVAWATGWFGKDLVLAASFQDTVLIDLAVRVDPGIEVVFLDTGFHFEETLDFVESVRRRYDLNLRVVTPELGTDEWPCGSSRCCELRKVEPLSRVLEGREAWMSGLRRSETPERAGAPVVSLDPRWGVVKVNPLATWTDDDVDRYVAERHLLVHPLAERGYGSIGCAPTTRPLTAGEGPRDGRWPGEERTECGLHW